MEAFSVIVAVLFAVGYPFGLAVLLKARYSRTYGSET